jgi:hypothetical protein
MMNYLIDHTATHINFIVYTLWHTTWFTAAHQEKNWFEADLPQFYIHTNPENMESLAHNIKKQIPAIPFIMISEENRLSFFNDLKTPTIHMESTMLIPRALYYSNITLPEPLEHKNLCFPLLSYKYNYKTVTSQGKKYSVKNFIRSTESFFDTDFIPDWDERFHITHNLLGKLEGSPPILSPSPLIHNWGREIRLIRKNSYDDPPLNEEKDFIVRNMSYAVHKFERVPDDSV